MSDTPTRIQVHEDILRCMFNHGDFLERIRSGDLQPIVYPKDSKIVTINRPHIPSGSVREMVYYACPGGPVEVLVNRFRLPNGELVASRAPDPKYITLAGIRYYVAEPQPVIQQYCSEEVIRSGYQRAKNLS